MSMKHFQIKMEHGFFFIHVLWALEPNFFFKNVKLNEHVYMYACRKHVYMSYEDKTNHKAMTYMYM